MATVLLALGLAASAAAPALADGAVAPVSTQPAANSVVAKAPSQLSITLPTAVGAGGKATVFGVDHTVVTTGALVPSAADPATATLALPSVKKGLYTVVWTAASGASTGTFAFSVDPTGAVETVKQVQPVIALHPIQSIVVSWIPWIAVMVLGGVLALRFLVVAPVIGRFLSGGEAGATQSAVDRRLVRVAAAAAAVLVVADLAELAYGVGKDHFAFGQLNEVFTSDWAGFLPAARVGAAVVAFVLLAAVALRPAQLGRLARPLMLAGLVLALVELVARVLPSAPPADVTRTTVTDVMTVAHLFAATFWIGGLVGMVCIAATSLVPAERRREFWPATVRRFSIVAMACVGAITLSGLWLYWVHVDGLGQLLSTLYGRTLGVKLLLFAGLLALGAFHEFLLMPKVEAYRAAGQGQPVMRLVAQNFRAAVAVEVVLGIAILLVVPMLAGSARNQAFQTAAADLTRTAKAGDVSVTLLPSGLVAGRADYDVTVSKPDAKQVTLSFASGALGVPAQSVEAKSLGGGQFRATGFYTPMAGSWDVKVAVDGGATPASFTLPVKAKAAKLAKAAPPVFTGTTWIWGIGETLLLVAGLLGSAWASRRISERRAANALMAAARQTGELQPSNR